MSLYEEATGLNDAAISSKDEVSHHLLDLHAKVEEIIEAANAAGFEGSSTRATAVLAQVEEVQTANEAVGDSLVEIAQAIEGIHEG